MSIFRQICDQRRNDQRTALIDHAPVSYADLVCLAQNYAKHMYDSGIRSDDPVTLALSTGLHHVAFMLAVRIIKATIVLANPFSTDSDLDQILSDSGSLMLVVTDDHRLAPSGSIHQDVSFIRTTKSRTFRSNAKIELILFTSGSTNRPKGVLLSENAVEANIKTVSKYLELTMRDRTVTFTPPQYALSVSQIFSHLFVGGAVVTCPRGLLEPYNLLKACRFHSVTGLQINPGSLRHLMQMMDNNHYFTQLRYILLLGQPITRDFVNDVRLRFPFIDIFNGYGCSENAPRISMGRIPDDVSSLSEPLSVGKPLTCTEVSIRDNTGNELGTDEEGQIYIRGESLMVGYLNRHSETDSRIVNGWFATRDHGFFDSSGNLYVRGRVDNIILAGHEKISPEEIEQRIREVPEVIDVVVCGVPDSQYYEIPVALLVCEDKSIDTFVRRHLQQVLVPVKRPKRYYFVTSIPHTENSKIDRVASRLLALRMERERR